MMEKEDCNVKEITCDNKKSAFIVFMMCEKRKLA
jgi:hypothetical protein